MKASETGELTDGEKGEIIDVDSGELQDSGEPLDSVTNSSIGGPVRRSDRIRKRVSNRMASLASFALTTTAYLTGSVNAGAVPSGYGRTFDSHANIAEHIHIPEPSNPVNYEEPRDTVANLSLAEMDQLQYVQAMDFADDLYQDSLTGDDINWTPVAVLNHKKRKFDSTDIHVKLLVQWVNGEATWQRMNDVRLQDPYVIKRYANEHKLTDHDDFSWVADYPDQGSDHHVFNAQVKPGGPAKRAMKYKFGTQVPMSVRHALKLDQLNANHEWRDAIARELKQINDYETFRQVTSEDDLSTYTQVPYHMVFDVKFDLRRKARLVANGSFSSTTNDEVYSGVVAMDTMRLAFQVAAMNDLQVCAADVGNAFLYGKTRERCFIVAGAEFGDLQGTPLIIDKGLYGLRTSAARFHEHLAAQLRNMNVRQTSFDGDLWI